MNDDMFFNPLTPDQVELHNLKERVRHLETILKGKILLVEDGSVDIDKLEKDGFYVINYRQGANLPQWLNKENSND